MQVEPIGPSEVSRHKCLIYDGYPSNQLPVVTPLLIDGLNNNWRCLYLGSPEMVDMVEGALRLHGVQTARETSRGAPSCCLPTAVTSWMGRSIQNR